MNNVKLQVLSRLEETKTSTAHNILNVQTKRMIDHAQGNPSIAETQAIIKMNLITNNHVTTEHFNLADEICDPDEATKKKIQEEEN